MLHGFWRAYFSTVPKSQGFRRYRRRGGVQRPPIGNLPTDMLKVGLRLVRDMIVPRELDVHVSVIAV
jgi:signal recognition particle subunit SEC65